MKNIKYNDGYLCIYYISEKYYKIVQKSSTKKLLKDVVQFNIFLINDCYILKLTDYNNFQQSILDSKANYFNYIDMYFSLFSIYDDIHCHKFNEKILKL